MAKWRVRSRLAKDDRPDRNLELFKLDALGESDRPGISVGDVILKRGSTRRFARKPIPFHILSTILEYSTGKLPADFLAETDDTQVEVYLNANDVEGIPNGAYYFEKDRPALRLLKSGEFRQASGYLCLEQRLAYDASVVVFFMANLDKVLESLGNRGYRVSHLEAGILGGRMYLAAYALGIGATGLTFFDDDVTGFFSPHAKGKTCLFVAAIGAPDYSTRPISWKRVPLRDPIVQGLLKKANERTS